MAPRRRPDGTAVIRVLIPSERLSRGVQDAWLVLALLGTVLTVGGVLLKLLLFVGVPLALLAWLWSRARRPHPGTP